MTPFFVGSLIYLATFAFIGALKSTPPADYLLAMFSSSFLGLAVGLAIA